MNIKQWINNHITLQQYDDREKEKINALTHLIAAILTVVLFFYVYVNLNLFLFQIYYILFNRLMYLR